MGDDTPGAANIFNNSANVRSQVGQQTFNGDINIIG